MCGTGEQCTLWKMHNRESDTVVYQQMRQQWVQCIQSTTIHKSLWSHVLVSFCLWPPLLKGHPNETAPRMPFKCHSGAQETMLRYRCYFEWCHGVKVAGLNYCRALWCCLYLCCLVNTYNHTADSWSTAWYCHYNDVGSIHRTSCHDDSAQRNLEAAWMVLFTQLMLFSKLNILLLFSPNWDTKGVWR